MAVTIQQQLGTSVESGFDTTHGQLVRTLVTRDSAGTVTHSSRSSVPSSEDTASLDAWWKAYFQGHRPRRLDGETPSVIRTVELFCGPGGLGLGFDQAAMELGYRTQVAAIVDQDAGAVGVYSRNRSVGLVTSESVTMLVDHQLRGSRSKARYPVEPEILDEQWRALRGTVDVVLAGPPCQGHSNLNNKTRRTDLRNELYLRVPAMAIALDAPMVVIENVPGVVHDTIGVVETTKTLLEAAGYSVTTGILHAARMGWPQTRSRFFLIARKGAVPIDVQSIEDDLADPDGPRFVEWAFDDIATDGRPDFMFEVPDMSPENTERIKWLFDNREYDLPNEQRPDCHKNGTTYTSVYGRMRPDAPAQTVTTGFFTAGRGRYIHPTERRVINAAEAARLQGFPDTYDFRPADGVDPARSQLGKWIGDAVPMPLGYAAGLSVLGGAVVEPRRSRPT